MIHGLGSFLNRDTDKIKISTQFSTSNKSFKLKIKPDIKNRLNLVAFIIELPHLMSNLVGSYEGSARKLVDNGMIDREEMRLILEISIISSIKELYRYLDLVKVNEEE